MNVGNTKLATKKIDVAKIEMVMKNNGITKYDIDKAMAHTKSYLSHCMKRGTMQPSDVLLFKALYGVDIELKEPVKVKESTSDKADADSMDINAIQTINDSIAHLEKVVNDADLDLLERVEKLEKITSNIDLSLRNIGNLLTQINEKCLEKKKPYVR